MKFSDVGEIEILKNILANRFTLAPRCCPIDALKSVLTFM